MERICSFDVPWDSNSQGKKLWRLNLRFMIVFDILKNGSSTLNFNCSDNIARIIKCYISKSKLALSTCNGVYFSFIMSYYNSYSFYLI